jgi:hypothetical protein
MLLGDMIHGHSAGGRGKRELERTCVRFLTAAKVCRWREAAVMVCRVENHAGVVATHL